MHLRVQLWFATSVTQTNWIARHPSGHVLMSTPTRTWQGRLFQKRLSPEHYVVQVLGDKGKTNLGMELILPSFETDLHYVTIHSPTRQWHAKCQWYSSILQLYYSPYPCMISQGIYTCRRSNQMHSNAIQIFSTSYPPISTSPARRLQYQLAGSSHSDALDG